jgi:3-oxoacyl-[acyl-carrier-protein] synthase-3
MHGRIYEFALTTVPAAMKSCLEKRYRYRWSQENFNSSSEWKMDEAIIARFINCTTDRFQRHYADEHKWVGKQQQRLYLLFWPFNTRWNKTSLSKKGDVLLFASVGAGMNVNASFTDINFTWANPELHYNPHLKNVFYKTRKELFSCFFANKTFF